MSEATNVSFAVEDMVEGGGLLSNVDVTWKNPNFTMWNYDGKVPVPVTALMVTLVDEEGKDHIQYWSVGAGWVPTQDGSSISPTGGGKSINAGSNFAILMLSLETAGVPSSKMKEGNIKIFEGMKCHMDRTPAPKRGVTKQPRADGKVFEDTILTITSVMSLPWEKAGKVGKSKVGSSAPPVGGEEVDLIGDATMAILEILAAKPNGLTRQQLAADLFAYKKKDPNRQALVNLVYQDGFLGEGPWTFENGTVKGG